MVKISTTTTSLAGRNWYYLAWGQAIAATLGSLYFSEIAHFPPCVLCWYQRIALYPLVIILGVGLLKRDKHLPLYVFPLVMIGLAISIFHNLLYYKILPEAAAPCVAGVSCTTQFIEWFGFVTIPFLAMLAFIVLLVTTYMGFRASR